MAETAYTADPKGLFTFPDFGDTEAGASFSGFPAGTKVYRALLTQSGTNAPVATVLDNTLGVTVVWTRNDVGVYFGSAPNQFPTGRTMVFLGEGQTLDSWGENGNLAAAKLEADDAIRVESGVAGTPADSLLFDTPIEIIVYP